MYKPPSEREVDFAKQKTKGACERKAFITAETYLCTKENLRGLAPAAERRELRKKTYVRISLKTFAFVGTDVLDGP